jgi:hypothetical protein
MLAAVDVLETEQPEGGGVVAYSLRCVSEIRPIADRPAEEYEAAADAIAQGKRCFVRGRSASGGYWSVSVKKSGIAKFSHYETRERRMKLTSPAAPWEGAFREAARRLRAGGRP